MTNVSVGTTATSVIAPGNRAGSLIIQNQSDTTIYLAVGDENIASLTSSCGLKIDAGEAIVIDGPTATLQITALHGSTGTKTVHVQLV